MFVDCGEDELIGTCGVELSFNETFRGAEDRYRAARIGRILRTHGRQRERFQRHEQDNRNCKLLHSTPSNLSDSIVRTARSLSYSGQLPCPQNLQNDWLCSAV